MTWISNGNQAHLELVGVIHTDMAMVGTIMGIMDRIQDIVTMDRIQDMGIMVQIQDMGIMVQILDMGITVCKVMDTVIIMVTTMTIIIIIIIMDIIITGMIARECNLLMLPQVMLRLCEIRTK